MKNENDTNRIDWLMNTRGIITRLSNTIGSSNVKKQTVEFLTKKPGVFIGPILLTILISYLILSPAEEDEKQRLAGASNSLFIIPSSDTKVSTKMVSTDSEILGNNEYVDSSLIEEKSANPVHSDNFGHKLDPATKSVKSWIFNKKPDQYTVQLVGSVNKKEVLTFIEDNKSLKQLSYFRTIKKGKSWYAVVYNTYESYTDANNARKRLPKHLAKNKPWVRKYGAIQQEINANAEKTDVLAHSLASTD